MSLPQDKVQGDIKAGMKSAPSNGILGPAMRPHQTALSRYDNYVPIIMDMITNVWTGFLNMDTRGRVGVTVAFVSFVGLVMLWPILFSLKVDGTISASWGAVWTPLWVFNVAGLAFFISLVSWGEIQAPPGMEAGWRDPYPVTLRIFALIRWCLLFLFQIFLTIRLDGVIDWPWASVMPPLVGWAAIRLLDHIWNVSRKSLPWGLSKLLLATPVVVANLLVLAQVIFVEMRLDDDVSWDWWVVFTPTWIIYALQLLSGTFGKCAAFSLSRVEGTEQAAAQARQLEEMKGVQFHRTTSHMSLPTMVSIVLAVMIVEGKDMTTFVVFIPQFLIAAVLVCLACSWCCFSYKLPKADPETAFEV